MSGKTSKWYTGWQISQDDKDLLIHLPEQDKRIFISCSSTYEADQLLELLISCFAVMEKR